MTFNEVLTGFDDILYTWLLMILVPVMAGMYILIGLLIIILNLGKIPAVFAEIFRSAFNFRAIFGGFTGSCMVYGIKRGLFSNERRFQTMRKRRQKARIPYFANPI